jgi:hypothetical protein
MKTNLEAAALDYSRLLEMQKQITADIKAYKERFGSMVNEEPGEYKISAGKFDIHVNRAEKYEWDQDILKTIWCAPSSGPTLVSVVDASFRVEKKKYQKLNAAEKALISPALTRKPGSTTVKVTLAGEETEDDDTSV